MTDLATRYTAVDVGIQGTLGGFNLMRRYVSSDKTWAYQSLLGNQAEAYLPKPFGGSPTNGNSLRWWHSLYSFVYPKGWRPGISTWAVRDTGGAVLEYEACSNGSTACFAKPRQTTLWSHDQLYWSGSQFILFKQGLGRYVYGDVWLPPPGYGDTGKRYFLTRIEDETLTPSGNARPRLQLTYASPESAPGQPIAGCPGLSRLGNGVPFLATATTEDGADLSFHYTLMKTGHQLVPLECVLQDIALTDTPHAPGNTSQQIVARYFYPNTSTPLAGLLEAVSYPETGDMVSYSGGTTTTWSVSVNSTTVATHSYDTSGKVATATSASSSSTSTAFSGSSDCGPSASSGSPSCTPPTASTWGGAGDSTESSVQIYRKVVQELTDYAPHPLVRSVEKSCSGGNCAGFGYYSHTSHSEESLNYSPLRTTLTVDQKNRWTTFGYVFTADASLSPTVPQPLSQKTQHLFGGDSSTPVLRTNEQDYVYGTPAPSVIPRPTKPLHSIVAKLPSVLQQGAQVETTRIYDEQTNQLKAVIQSGWTKRFDGTAWSAPLQRFIGTFYFTYQKCSGETPGSGGGEFKEVHGPCFVTGPDAIDCDQDASFPVKQYSYYPSTEPSNRANRLWKTALFPRLVGQGSCVGAPSTDTVFNDYDVRGNVLSVTDPNGVTTTIQRQGGRITSMTTAGATTHLFYAEGKLVAEQHHEGNFDVFCYRSGTAPGGQGCAGGTVTDKLQWTAKAADAQGSTWSESQTFEYWPDGTLKQAQYASALEPNRTRRQERFVHDGLQRLTRHYQGYASSNASVYSYDHTSKLTGVGYPINQAPDFCAPDVTGTPTSELCTLLKYDDLDRLTQVDEFPASGVRQQTRFGYDEQDNVKTVQTGCDGQATCTAPVDTYVYDDFGNLLEAALPQAGQPTRYAYNALGRIVIKQTPTMVRWANYLSYAYDGLGRPLWSKAMNSPTSGILLYALGYDDDEGPPADCEQNLRSRGRLRYREDSFGRTWYQYDLNGRVQREMRLRHPLASAHCGQGNDTNPDTLYSYTPNGNLASITYPHGRRVDYLYGTGALKDRVTGLNVFLFEGSTWTAYPLVSNVTWEPYGGLRGYQLLHQGSSNSSSVEYMLGGPPNVPPSSSSAACSLSPLSQAYPSNDWTGRLRALRVSSGAVTPGEGGGDIYRRTYTWTANLVTRIDTCLLDETTARTEEFQYDRTLRLVGATRPTGNFTAAGGSYTSRTYGYDRRGNRAAMTEDGIVYTLQYAQAPFVDRLLQKIPSTDSSLKEEYASNNYYEEEGRVTDKASGWSATRGYAQHISMAYLDSSMGVGSFPAVDSVLKYVDVNGAGYTYFYDAFGRRRLKSYPLGTQDEFFYDLGGVLLSDRGNNRVDQPIDYYVEDDYVWLGGRPVVLIRGKLTSSWERQTDWSTDCARNGEASTCGVYFPVTDLNGKPVVMLDASRRIANAADYDPFGRVNRVTQHVRVPPYTSTPSDTSVALLSQPITSSRLSLRMKALFGLMDTVQNSPECTSAPFDAYVVLRNPSTGADLSEFIGGRTTQSSWVPANTGQVNVSFVTTGEASVMGTYDVETGWYVCNQYSPRSGVALKGYEYQRYEVGAHPFWTPLRFPGHYYDAETDLFENWNRYYDPSIGRYLQPEPLLSIGPVSLPAYEYALSNPISFGDLTGLFPGHVFRVLNDDGKVSMPLSRNAAALDALLYIHPSSELNQVEYGGMLCQRKDGGVFATEPICGDSEDTNHVTPSESPCPEGTKPVGDYHTHFDDGDADNRSFPFSLGDTSGANSIGQAAYLSRPGPEVWRYDPIPFVIRVRIYP